MSTRSYICKVEKDGTLTGVYCHNDGYLEGVGAVLFKHYKTRKRVNALIALGNLSSVHPKLAPTKGVAHSFDNPAKGVTVAYVRDRGEKGQEPQKVTLENLTSSDSWIDYVYVFGLDGRWRYLRTFDYWKNKKTPFVLYDLGEALDKLS